MCRLQSMREVAATHRSEQAAVMCRNAKAAASMSWYDENDVTTKCRHEVAVEHRHEGWVAVVICRRVTVRVSHHRHATVAVIY